MFLVSAGFWWSLAFIFFGIVVAVGNTRLLEIPVGLIAGVCFFIYGVLSLIAALGGARSGPPA